MKKIVLALLSLVALQTVNAQISLTTLTYAQNFNSLDTTSTPSGVLPAGWQISELGSASADANYIGGAGTSNAGNTYSFGSAGATDRALGSVGSGNNRSRYGVGFTNNTGATITSVTINYKMEQWRLGDTATASFPNYANKDTTLFQYSATASGVADTLSSWLGNGALDLTSAITYSLVKCYKFFGWQCFCKSNNKYCNNICNSTSWRYIMVTLFRAKCWR
jgi:uncharacterized protein